MDRNTSNILKAESVESSRSDLKMLLKLVADRPLRTNEIYRQNDFYGHATILKNYVGISQKRTVKASIEHGYYLGGFVSKADIKTRLPAILVASKCRIPILRKHTEKRLIPIGPLLAYAPHLLAPQELESEKRRLGKSLLIFPAHSTHFLDSHFDVDEYCRHLSEIAREFNSIRVCLYWKDILRGRANDFGTHGFECVTAGHIFDPLFLPRLKSIIECSTATASNELGTHLGYCVSMGKPHYIFSGKVTWAAESRKIVEDAALERLEHPEVVEIKHAFSEWRNDISPKQKQIIEHHWGLNEKKSVEEMREIFHELDQVYRKQSISCRLRNRLHVLRRGLSVLTWKKEKIKSS